ncbi:MAG: hypothetical protein NVS9B1_11500 [Candidatus Dormibacteraceae bacterium]
MPTEVMVRPVVLLLIGAVLSASCGVAHTDTTHCKRVLERQPEYGLIYPGSKVRDHRASEGSSDPLGFANSQPPNVVLHQVTTDGPELIAAWYSAHLQDLGWTVVKLLTRRPEGAFEVSWRRPGAQSYVTIVSGEIAGLSNANAGDNLVTFIFSVNDPHALRGCD